MHSQDMTLVSHFFHIGKKIAWKVKEAHDEFTESKSMPSDVAALLNGFTVLLLLYNRTSQSTSEIQTRKILFTCKGRTLLDLPPTEAALQQHMKRAVLQGRHH